MATPCLERFSSLIILGVLVHLIYLASMFDIYFTSPLVHGMKSHKSKHPAPAKRLVLFILDGLRADNLFELDKNSTSNAPFLRNIIQTRGAWGVSHTRVPTESRPGHVAVIAGFYEDVSAVTKGWKENPVEFDNVLNQTLHTWSWGSPEILNIFDKGQRGNIDSYMYSLENDLASDGADIDTWVFNNFKKFLTDAKQNATLMKMLERDEIVFFLHLLGLDTTGHTFRPVTETFYNHLRMVDKGVQDCVMFLEEFYNHDERTAYVATSDHGMTDWGSHGAGHLHETRTPLVVWGAGVRGPVPYQNIDQETIVWGLDAFKRTDVEQADVAPLMSSLLGINYPLNSVGTLPVDFLNNTEEFKADNLLVNAQQIMAQYVVKETFRRQTSLLFRAFQPLSASRQVGITRKIKELIHSREFSKASSLSLELINLSLRGLSYYHNYDRTFLSIVVTLGFMGWILFVIIQLARPGLESPSCIVGGKQKLSTTNLIFIAVAIVTCCVLLVQTSPLSYYIYCSVPLLFWNYIVSKIGVVASLLRSKVRLDLIAPAAGMLFTCLVALEILVMSFFHRKLLSLGLVLIGLWSLTTKLKTVWKITWIGSSFLLAVFPLLPVVGHEPNNVLVVTAGILGFVCLVLVYWFTRLRVEEQTSRSKLLILVQMILILLSTFIVYNTTSNLAQNNGLPRVNQVLSWIILALAFIIPAFSSKTLVLRLFSSLSGLFSAYLLVSISYEGLFFLALSIVVTLWLYVEFSLSWDHGIDLTDVVIETYNDLLPFENLKNNGKHVLTSSDIRRAYFFLFFLILSFLVPVISQA